MGTYTAAYRQYRDPIHLAKADRADHDLINHFQDTKPGGFYWSISATPLSLAIESKSYGPAFAIYASGKAAPVILPELLTPGKVLDALAEASAR